MSATATSLKTESLVLRRVAAVGQKTAADAIGVNESQLSRFLSGEGGLKFSQLTALLELLEITCSHYQSEIVPVESEELHALRVLARKGLEL